LTKERFNSVWQAIIKSLSIPQLTYALTSLPSPGELFLNDIERFTFNPLIFENSLNILIEVLMEFFLIHL
jgi:hypothetical protein